jgi:hypothetical protein
MRRARLAVLLVLSMALAGCLGPTTASWGKDSGAVHVDFNQESTTITTSLGSESQTFTGIEPIGCATEEGELGTNTTTPVSFPGYLASSAIYSSHSDADVSGLDFAVTASVAIEQMSSSSAESVVEGEGSRIDLKSWLTPLQPKTGMGTVNLEKINSDAESKWYVLGLIPTTKNIQEGMLAVGEWHQSVTIYGYLVQLDSSNSNSLGTFNSQEANSDCSIKISSSNNERLYVLVTSIELSDSTVSSSGGDTDEWVHGDVPVFTLSGYILFFMIVGIGGGVGAFILSKMFVLQGAKASMKNLIGKSGMDAVKQVKKDVKSAKASGLSSPSDRQKESRKQAEKTYNEPKSKSSESALAGFDLDSVLSSGPSTSSTNEFGGGKSSVVKTEESKEMERDFIKPTSEFTPPSNRITVPPRQSSTNITSSQPTSQPTEHFTSAAPKSKAASGPPKRKTVRKRKAAVKQEQPEVTPEPQPQERQTYDEPDEDFSDFSF